jgi:hypothetical protein
VIDRLSRQLAEILDSDLKDISPVLRVATEVTVLIHAIKTYFDGNAGYAKGKGASFYHWMRTFHPERICILKQEPVVATDRTLERRAPGQC